MHMHRHAFERPIPLVQVEENGGTPVKPSDSRKLTAKWVLEEGKLVCKWVRG